MVALVVLVVVRLTNGSSSAPSAATNRSGTTALSTSAEEEVTHVPASILASVGTPSTIEPPQRTMERRSLLRAADGEPRIVYVGAEFCPFCAAERWPLVVALSRFGTFTGLRATHSSAVDAYPNTPTLSFYGSTYVSRYVSFSSVETTTNQVDGRSYKPLQKPTAEESRLMQTYDVPPYTTTPGTIPFIDFANRFLQEGASYDPRLLAGQSQGDIANELSQPSNAIAQSIDGTANLLTATICNLTGGQPSRVCSMNEVKAATERFAASTSS